MEQTEPRLVVIDCETTGFSRYDRIVEIAVVTLDSRTLEPVDEYDTLVNPERDLDPLACMALWRRWWRLRPCSVRSPPQLLAGSMAGPSSPTTCRRYTDACV